MKWLKCSFNISELHILYLLMYIYIHHFQPLTSQLLIVPLIFYQMQCEQLLADLLISEVHEHCLWIPSQLYRYHWQKMALWHSQYWHHHNLACLTRVGQRSLWWSQQAHWVGGIPSDNVLGPWNKLLKYNTVSDISTLFMYIYSGNVPTLAKFP